MSCLHGGVDRGSHICVIYIELMIGCGIRDEGAKRMGQMLEMNGTLIHLNLEGEIPLNIPSFLCSVTDNHR